MIDRPFPVQYHHSPEAHSLEIHAITQTLVPTQEAKVKAIHSPFEHFHQVGALGGLSGKYISPTDSALELVTSVTESHEFRWTFRTVNIHPGSLFIAENLLHDLHLKHVSLKKVAIISDLIQNGVQPNQELPFVFEPLPFDYTIELERNDLLIDLEFEMEQKKDVRVQFEKAWWDWLGLAHCGGFADETFLPGEMRIYAADEPGSFPDSIEFALDDVAVSHMAFDTLVNIFYKLHFQVAKLTSVAIY